MNDQEVQFINKNRYLLIKWFSFQSKVKPSEAAELLLKIGLQQGYIQPGKELSGNKLKTWGMQKKAPEWACRAAAFYLNSGGYKPDSDVGKILLDFFKKLDS